VPVKDAKQGYFRVLRQRWADDVSVFLVGPLCRDSKAQIGNQSQQAIGEIHVNTAALLGRHFHRK
jgi:hypothetical protein